MPTEATKLRYSQLPGRYAICRLRPRDPLPDWAAPGGEFGSITRTTEELSIVCREREVPPGIDREAGWICFRLEGPFPFTETGILASFLTPLSRQSIPIFSISTWDTDYVLVKEESKGKAITALKDAGHEFTSASGSTSPSPS